MYETSENFDTCLRQAHRVVDDITTNWKILLRPQNICKLPSINAWIAV